MNDWITDEMMRTVRSRLTSVESSRYATFTPEQVDDAIERMLKRRARKFLMELVRLDEEVLGEVEEELWGPYDRYLDKLRNPKDDVVSSEIVGTIKLPARTGQVLDALQALNVIP